MAANNATIMGKVWLNGTNDFQQRVPQPDQTNLAQVFENIFAPMNKNLYNQFIDSFINLIAAQRIHDRIWENPLTPFKSNRLLYGSTIQEAAPKWIKAHSYSDSATDLLKMERPDFAVYYHSLNRQDKYPISVTRPEMMQAVRDEYGLNRMANAIMNVPINSDNYDEYLMMMQTIAEYENRWGFYKHQLSAAPTDEATGKEFLTAIRSYANLLMFPSTLYNHGDVPVFAPSSELVLIIDAKSAASVDVNTLSSVFQLDKADIQYRKIVVPELPVPNAFALLTTEDYFVVNDIVYANDNFYDPNTLSTKYILHHWEIVSASPFVPAILFTTEAGTVNTTLTQSVTGVAITPDSANAAPGDEVQLTVALQGTITENAYGIEVEPDAVTWSVSAMSQASEGEAIALDTTTYVDAHNVLHIQDFDLEAGNVLTVTGTTTYINPSGATARYTDSSTITIQ